MPKDNTPDPNNLTPNEIAALRALLDKFGEPYTAPEVKAPKEDTPNDDRRGNDFRSRPGGSY